MDTCGRESSLIALPLAMFLFWSAPCFPPGDAARRSPIRRGTEWAVGGTFARFCLGALAAFRSPSCTRHVFHIKWDCMKTALLFLLPCLWCAAQDLKVYA